MKVLLLIAAVTVTFAAGCVQQPAQTSYKINDNITIAWLGHSSFHVDAWKTIYFDPFVLDSNAKQADFILITHEHFDHCSPESVKKIQANMTRIISTKECINKLSGKINSIKPTEFFNYSFDYIYISAFDAYNNGKPYHLKGEGVGFLLNLNGTRIYHAGDTDNIPEFANLTKENIDVLLIPIGGKYTMNVSEAAEAVKIIRPKIVIPMHYNSGKYGIADVEANANEFKKLLKDSGTEVVVLAQPA